MLHNLCNKQEGNRQDQNIIGVAVYDLILTNKNNVLVQVRIQAQKFEHAMDGILEEDTKFYTLVIHVTVDKTCLSRN